MNEYEGVAQDTGFINLETEYDLISVSGPDARFFLNRILTNDIKTLKEGKGCYSCICSPKGKILADLFCYAISDALFVLECRQELKSKILDLLKKYSINQKVEFYEGYVSNPESDVEGAYEVLGSKAHAWFKKCYPNCLLSEDFSHEHFIPPEEYKITEEPQSTWIVRKNKWGYPCYEFRHEVKLKRYVPEPHYLSKSTQEILRIESKTPLYGVDMDEHTIPQEANLFHALNFQKGCYVGQETIARLQNLGHVNKQLVLLKIEGQEEVSKESKILTQGGEEMGFITSQCFSPKYQSQIALGYIRYTYLKTSGPFKIDKNSCWIIP